MYETLPSSVKESTFEGIVQAMKERLRVDSNGECMEAMTQLSTQTMSQTIAKFCLVLERLFSRAYPDTGKCVAAGSRAPVWQLAKWEGSYCIAKAVETSDRSLVYKKVKEVALRVEKNREMAENMALQKHNSTRHRVPYNRKEVTGRQENLGMQENRLLLCDSRTSEVTSKSGTEAIRGAPESKQNPLEAPVEGRQLQCFNCDRKGHNSGYLKKEIDMHWSL